MRLALVGYGRMGRTVDEVATKEGHEVVARIDRADALTAEAVADAEVAIEFTVPGATVDNVRQLAAFGVDVVVGTTGWFDDLDRVRAAVEEHGIGLIHAPNFSLGVQLFFRAARTLGALADVLEEYDVHVQEAHHRHKVDHPSGTARRLAELLVEVLGRKERWEEGPPDGPADPGTLWVSASRAGEIPGIHTVALEGPDDRIELTHTAGGRTGFARGALAAAAWIRGRKGLHTLDDMLEERFEGGSRHT